MNNKEIIKQAIDLHVHVGPEIIPRKFDLSKLMKFEKGRIKGLGIKNHFFPTVAMSGKSNFGMIIIDSVTLNNYLGGFNVDIIRASAELSKYPIIVWMPTINAKNFIKDQKYEIAKEWVDKKKRDNINFRLAKEAKSLSIYDKNKIIRKEVIEVLRIIKKYDSILATGHISWQESCVLVKYAVKKIGIKRIIITHPIYQKINMPINKQKELVSLGAYIEFCYSMYSIDKISIKKIAKQIKFLGAENCILSSDVGQSFAKYPSEALLDFTRLLKGEGITKEELKIMLVKNPKRLVFI